MKTSDPQVQLIESAPKTGIYHLNDDGTIEYQRNTLDWHYLTDSTEAFFLRVYGPGEYLFKGADLGILVSKARMQTDESQLTEGSRHYIDGIRALYRAKPVETGMPTEGYLAYLK